MYTIYPNPGSYNDFKARNPEIVDHSERIRHISIETSMWRATSPDIDLTRATLSIGERAIRNQLSTISPEDIVVLDEWPKVGGYDVPAILNPAA
jgi:hypothetical protein